MFIRIGKPLKKWVQSRHGKWVRNLEAFVQELGFLQAISGTMLCRVRFSNWPDVFHFGCLPSTTSCSPNCCKWAEKNWLTYSYLHLSLNRSLSRLGIGHYLITLVESHTHTHTHTHANSWEFKSTSPQKKSWFWVIIEGAIIDSHNGQ